MTENSAEKIEIDRDKFTKMSGKDHAEICVMVVKTLQQKAEELGDLYKTLMTTYKEEMLLTGISVVCAVNAEPFTELEGAPIQFMLGTPEGIMKAFMPLIRVVETNVAPYLNKGGPDETDKETD